MTWRNSILTVALLAGGAASSLASEAADILALEGPPGFGPHAGAVMMAHGFEGKVVKGAPYSAEAVTEIVQTLADGNRIVRKTNAAVFRDSEGRTRREHTLGAVGPLVVADDAPPLVFIHDPVAGASYVLEVENRVAMKLPPMKSAHFAAKEGAAAGGAGEAAGDADVIFYAHGAASGRPGMGARTFQRKIERGVVIQSGGDGAPEDEVQFVAPPPDFMGGPLAHSRALRHDLPKPETESLGRQTIEGIEAEGTRTTITIPAGEIGNEKQIEIVAERWYSADLQAVVLSRRSDPRFGDTTYRLTGINRSEPDQALFEVPQGFTIKEGSPEKAIRKSRKKLGK
jgi:hypothetical protein